MVANTSSVVVVGAGIMGASVAWHLARLGARVTVLEQGARPAAGVTRWSYGWVGTASASASENPVALNATLQAIADFRRLALDLGPLPVAARGALVWLDNDEQTACLIDQQQAAGVRLHPLDAQQASALEPCLVTPPRLAAWAPDDFAVEPVALTRQLLHGAKQAGAQVLYGRCVDGLEMNNGRVTAALCAGERFAAHTVVLANADAAIGLAGQQAFQLPILTKPAVLMRFSAPAGVVRHLVYGNGLELRPALEGGVACAEDAPAEGEAGLPALAEHTAEAIKRMFIGTSGLSLRAVSICRRPMTQGGEPVRGYLPGAHGVYALIAHPGVILAPYLGRLAAEEIVQAGC
ncbi:FAD-binding oxidoreductase [Pseudomonas sp. S60]|uniref:NAD(P)/FAD-dependent oxidoreductase n=1 Tax=unclassified Pseudomonas TaxID=196821 RepID=UPI001912CBFC|nr:MULTISPECIES: FAD-binding oxidoreductase [unclassified Pseudomonas]MBK5005564.1 FAD-binding oxidoreductase [Pseudomonas sp. S32]MBK5010362.1 FAD-binding oxidoreductase [Pseudomonas sp. S60]